MGNLGGSFTVKVGECVVTVAVDEDEELIVAGVEVVEVSSSDTLAVRPL